MRSVSPIIAIVILLLMTLGAGGMAYMMIVQYQEQSRSAASSGTEHVSALARTSVKVEEVSDGKVYVRNSGTEPLREITITVEGRPISATGPDVCQPGDLCVFSIDEVFDCSGDCSLKVDTATGSSTPELVEQEKILPSNPPMYFGWSLNTSSIQFGEAILANITWDSGISVCTLVSGCYGFSNQTFATQEAQSVEWGGST